MSFVLLGYQYIITAKGQANLSWLIDWLIDKKVFQPRIEISNENSFAEYEVSSVKCLERLFETILRLVTSNYFVEGEGEFPTPGGFKRTNPWD